MTLQIRTLALEGLLEIVPRKFPDARGFLSEAYSAASFAAAGIDIRFVQDNHSYSAVSGVLRGLHYQLAPAAQAKLVRVIRGAIFDVAVDIRQSSPTFGKWTGLELSVARWNQVLIPEGFAHGFVTIEDDTEVLYKVSSPYAPECERTIRFDDPAIGIAWPVTPGSVRISEKDSTAPLLNQAEVFA